MHSENTNQPGVNASSVIEEKIKEAELYLTQGLFEEARQIYQGLLDSVAPPAEEAAGDSPTSGAEDSQRRFLQDQLALIDRQEAEFLGHPPEADPERSAAATEVEGAALFNRGQALLEIGRFADAIHEFQRAAELEYQPLESALQIGKAHIQLGQPQEGIQVLEEACKSKDLGATDLNRFIEQLAMGYEAAADKAKALELYRRLATSDPNHSTAAKNVKRLTTEILRYHVNVVKLHLKNRQFLKAVQELRLLQRDHQFSAETLEPLYEQVLHADPDNREAVQQLTELYKQMLGRDAANVETRLKFARHLLRAGQFDSAVSEYLAVLLEDTPHKMVALKELGEALMERQDYDRVLELLEDALPWVESSEPRPETFSYYYLLGTACQKNNLHTQAQTYFERAAVIDPDHEAIRAKLEAQIKGPLISQGKSLLRLPIAEKREYQIMENLGEDEIMQIFRVSAVTDGTSYTAKTLLPKYSGEPKVKDFVVKWAYEQMTMDNRNISRVLDVAECQGQYFIIMEYFQSNLDELLKKETRLPLAQGVKFARILLNGLAYAHSHRGTDDVLRKIFHLALNPRRVVVSRDIATVKIADFGLMTQLSTVLNLAPSYQELSPYQLAYMAPEQFSRSALRMPDKMKQATDLYAFGLLFYQMITGKLPFHGPSPEDFKNQHIEQYPVPPRVYISKIPPKLDEAILRCLHKDPKKRWRTPTELDLALEKLNLRS